MNLAARSHVVPALMPYDKIDAFDSPAPEVPYGGATGGGNVAICTPLPFIGRSQA